jgi:hypothetical protein
MERGGSERSREKDHGQGGGERRLKVEVRGDRGEGRMEGEVRGEKGEGRGKGRRIGTHHKKIFLEWLSIHVPSISIPNLYLNYLDLKLKISELLFALRPLHQLHRTSPELYSDQLRNISLCFDPYDGVREQKEFIRKLQSEVVKNLGKNLENIFKGLIKGNSPFTLFF